MKNATLIYNPIAGRQPKRRQRQVREAAAVLEKAGIAVRLAPTSEPGSARELAKAAASQADRLVLACGGDGTINEVLNGILPGEATLGILPGGTANVFAKELRLPHHPVAAALDLPRWKSRRIALGRMSWPNSEDGDGRDPAAVNERYFLSLAGVGFDAYVISKSRPRLTMALGAVAYAMEAGRQALRYAFPPFVCRVDGREYRATFAAVNRTKRYGGWLRMAPTADIFQPRFSVCLFKSSNRLRYFFYGAAILARQHLRLRDVELVETCKIVCDAEEAHPPVYFEVDGELAGTLPATCEIVPDALNILVP